MDHSDQVNQAFWDGFAEAALGHQKEAAGVKVLTRKPPPEAPETVRHLPDAVDAFSEPKMDRFPGDTRPPQPPSARRFPVSGYNSAPELDVNLPEGLKTSLH